MPHRAISPTTMLHSYIVEMGNLSNLPIPRPRGRQATPRLVKWTPAAGKVTGLLSINCANARSKEGVSSIEAEKSFDRLVFEGYREGCWRADGARVDGLKVHRNGTPENN